MIPTGDKRKLYIIMGAGFAALLAVGLGLAISSNHKNDKKMNDQPTGLTFNISDAPPMDSKKPLRCFVAGAYVGTLTLSECAEKNGVAAQQLDVGLDDTGNLAAAPTASLAPPPATPVTAQPSPQKDVQPQTEVIEEPNVEEVPVAKPTSGPVAACLRYSGNSWNRLTDSVSLGQCVQMLYDGRCEGPGSASYGRWDGKTLRLVPKKVEISDDNKNFRTLVRQGSGCSVPLIK